MPELIEVELYRRLADQCIGREVAAVVADDAWYLKRQTTPEGLVDAMVGATIERTRRIGKLLLLDLDTGPVVGLRFGMTGRLIVDEYRAIDRLEYSSRRDEPGWDRFLVRFVDGGSFRMQDPRRLGGVELDPDESRLGIEASTVTAAQLRRVLAGGSTTLKARLLDQSHLAGIGNLLVDETLWRAGLDPARSTGSLDPPELRRLARHLRTTVADLTDRGGSHTGDLHEARNRGGLCPRDGHPLQRRTIGGRTTYSCPSHQS